WSRSSRVTRIPAECHRVAHVTAVQSAAPDAYSVRSGDLLPASMRCTVSDQSSTAQSLADSPSEPTLRSRRSCLAVPGSNPRFLEKAKGLEADQVFLDIEDAVAPLAKP